MLLSFTTLIDIFSSVSKTCHIGSCQPSLQDKSVCPSSVELSQRASPFCPKPSSSVSSKLTVLRRLLSQHAGSAGSNCHGYPRRKGRRSCQAPILPNLFFVSRAETGNFIVIIDRMMDCWHLTLKELIDALYVCKEHLKLDGEKCVDFIHFTLPPSSKGDSPMKQCA